MNIAPLLAQTVERVPAFGPDVHLDSLPTIAGMVFVLLLVFGPLIIILGAIVLIVKSRATRRDQLITYALQMNQPEVAQTLLAQRPNWIAWIVIGIVTIVMVAKLPWWVSMIVIIVAIATFKEWGGMLMGDRRGKRRDDMVAQMHGWQPSQPHAPGPWTAPGPQPAPQAPGPQAPQAPQPPHDPNQASSHGGQG